MLTTLLAMNCKREEKPAPPPKPVEPAKELAPWTFHILGALLVIEGEVDQTTELVLKGNALNVSRTVEFGPVRWEMYRPPPNEVAELRTKDGRLLARWDFDHPAPKPQPARPPKKIKEKPVPKPVPPPVKAIPEKPKPSPEKPKPVPVPPKQIPEKPKLVPPPPKPVIEKPKPVPPPHKPVPAPPKPIPEKLKSVPPPPKTVSAPPKPVPAQPKPVPEKSKALPPKPQEKIPSTESPQMVETIPQTPRPQPSGKATWSGVVEGMNLLRGPQGQQRMCITFDGGSTAEVASEVLDVLKARNIQTTFFVTGQFIRKFPEIVRRMHFEDHEIGNHTMNHPHFAPNGVRDPRLTRERFQRELLDADEELLRLLGRHMDPFWRAPYGEQTLELRKWAEEVGYRHVGWSEGADTLDWATAKERKLYRSGNAILDRLYQRMHKSDGDGLIVLMHLGSARPEADRPARVLGPFLDRAQQEGWRFVKISEYLRDMGRTH